MIGRMIKPEWFYQTTVVHRFLHPLTGLACWLVVVGGCMSLVLSMTVKLLQAKYRLSLDVTVTLNFLPQNVKDIVLVACPSVRLHWGTFRPIWPVLKLWGFAGLHGCLLRDMKSP